VLKQQVAGLVAGWALIILGRNLSVVSDGILRFTASLRMVRPPAQPAMAGDHRFARIGFVAAGIILIALALLAPLLG
jgi:hypothetical protein